jgi:hypothetical protein
MTATYRLNGWGRFLGSAPLLPLVAAGLVGCGSLLEVENPNNIASDDIELPVAAGALVNGAQRHVSFGVNGILLLAAEATDELEWCGSRDGWLELDQGRISNGYNEFTDAYYPSIARARWLADEAVKILEAQQAAGTLIGTTNLARAYLWASIAYVSIADLFDDFTMSDRQEPAPPIGRANMRGLYDTAIGYLNKGLPLATGTLALQIRMMRARAYFSKAVWDLVSPPPKGNAGTVSAASADVASAVTDATAALAALPSADYRLQFTFSATIGTSEWGGWINSRQEMRLAPPYVERVGSNKWGATILLDPISGAIDPVVDAIQKEFTAGGFYVGFTVVSAREMHLILAEARLAAGAVTGGNSFETHINNLRALNSLPNWTGAGGQPTALALLTHSRQVNLFLQGRRLVDMYRFGVTSPAWLGNSQAVTRPGTLLPISVRECQSNSYIGSAKCST